MVIRMIKFYCPKCHDICEYMCNKSTIIYGQPMAAGGVKVASKFTHSENYNGAICMLCKSILSNSAISYMVNTKICDDREYADIIDIIEIHKREEL